MNYTIVCPVHNEEKMLLKTLSSIFAINPTEVIFGLDRCSDKSEKIINYTAELLDYRRRGTLILRYYDENDGADWKFRSAYLRRDAYRLSHNDVILNTSADIVLDSVILTYLDLVPEHGLVSFGYLEKPWTIQCFLRALFSGTGLVHGFAGLLALSRKAWMKTEDIEHLKTIEGAEDTHLHLAMRKHYQTLHFNTRSIHLRPNETARDHYLRGVNYYNYGIRNNIFTAFVSSLLMIRPASFVGYCHARRSKSHA